MVDDRDQHELVILTPYGFNLPIAPRLRGGGRIVHRGNHLRLGLPCPSNGQFHLSEDGITFDSTTARNYYIVFYMVNFISVLTLVAERLGTNQPAGGKSTYVLLSRWSLLRFQPDERIKSIH
jgi:hypothetical protein